MGCLSGHCILVVEDEPLVSLDIADALTACGAHVVCSPNIAGAVAIVDHQRVSAAILDINLGGEDCSVLCRHLAGRRIPFVFYTGYTLAPDGWADIPMIAKPARPERIVHAAERLCKLQSTAA
jgi:DNA-binding response OmpR family regulator